MTGTGTSSDPIRPKYLDELKLHWSGIDFPDRGVFLLSVVTEDTDKISQLEANADVINISTNKAATRTRLKQLRNINIKAGDDLVQKFGRLKFENFSRADINVTPFKE